MNRLLIIRIVNVSKRIKSNLELVTVTEYSAIDTPIYEVFKGIIRLKTLSAKGHHMLASHVVRSSLSQLHFRKHCKSHGK